MRVQLALTLIAPLPPIAARVINDGVLSSILPSVLDSVLIFLVRGFALVAHGVVKFAVRNTNQLAFNHPQMTR